MSPSSTLVCRFKFDLPACSLPYPLRSPPSLRPPLLHHPVRGPSPRGGNKVWHHHQPGLSDPPHPTPVSRTQPLLLGGPGVAAADGRACQQQGPLCLVMGRLEHGGGRPCLLWAGGGRERGQGTRSGACLLATYWPAFSAHTERALTVGQAQAGASKISL